MTFRNIPITHCIGCYLEIYLLSTAQWAAKGGHDSLGMKEWSDWPYILFLRVVWPKKSFKDIFRAPVSSQTKLFRYFEFSEFSTFSYADPLYPYN